jgi:hypothetical protein
MAIKTFTTGEVLTSADTNTYLANSGLVYITTATASNTATTLNVVGCFSSAFTNYRLSFTGTSSAAASDIYIRMLNGSTPVTTGTYGWAFVGQDSRGTSKNTNGFDQTSAYTGMTTFNAPNEKHHANLDVMSPFVAVRTFFLGQATGINSGLNAFSFINGGSYQESATSFDGFQIVAASNLTTSVRVYGYRQV